MKKAISYITVLVIIPLLIICGAAFGNRAYAPVYIMVALLSCIPFFMSYESKKVSTTEIVTLAVITAVSAFGRVVFAVIPHFKPVTAVVVICGLYMGSGAGFVCGAMSALVSNIYFGQGPWTPLQMFSWGIIGFVSGFVPEKWRENKAVSVILALVSGVLFSLLMEVYGVISISGEFNLKMYFARLLIAAPVTASYVISNVIFLLVLGKPMGNVIKRIKNKYLY